MTKIKRYQSISSARKHLFKDQSVVMIDSEQLSFEEFRKTYVIWVQFTNNTSGIKRRDELEKYYGKEIADALNVENLPRVKTEIGLEFFQPDNRLVSDIAFRELIFLRTNRDHLG